MQMHWILGFLEVPLSEISRNAKVDSLSSLIDKITQSVSTDNARLLVLSEKQNVLNENRKVGTSVTPAQLKQAIDFYEAEVTRIKTEEISLRRSIESKNKEKSRLERQIGDVNQKGVLPVGEIEIQLEADSPVSDAIFEIIYLVGNAGWHPKYDIRVADIRQPLSLTYKAEVFQNTGVDWNKVKLRFSSGNPNQSGVAPQLITWNLNYSRYDAYKQVGASGNIAQVRGKVTDKSGGPLPGVSLLVKGRSIGTVTDADGNYSLLLPSGAQALVFSFIGYFSQEVPITKSEINISMQADTQPLEEVVVTGYVKQQNVLQKLSGAVAGVNRTTKNTEAASAQPTPDTPVMETRLTENQTTVEIEVEKPYTIVSAGEKLFVDLKKHEIDAQYEYYAIPKLDKDAFLVARVINWDRYNLLEGEANLYFEDAFVGRTILDTYDTKDTLDISLGRDKSIVVSREKQDTFSKKRVLNTNQTDTRGFKITIRNRKSQPVKLNVLDQVPVSVNNDITVTPLELTKGNLDAKTGKIIWSFELEPQKQRELFFQYEVKYPKNEKVTLE